MDDEDSGTRSKGQDPKHWLTQETGLINSRGCQRRKRGNQRPGAHVFSSIKASRRHRLHDIAPCFQAIDSRALPPHRRPDGRVFIDRFLQSTCTTSFYRVRFVPRWQVAPSSGCMGIVSGPDAAILRAQGSHVIVPWRIASQKSSGKRAVFFEISRHEERLRV